MLEALQAASPNRFRGIRHTVTWDPHPEVGNREQEGVLATADFRAGAQVLARMGLSLDTGLCFPQLPELAAFAQAVPDLTIILNHLGGLTRVGPYANRDDEVLPTWRRGIAAVAACPNVYLKLGGIGMPRLGFDWHDADQADRLGGVGHVDGAVHDLLHRAVWPRPLHVRKQLPAG